jgi:endonuclease/exonuclease/phosphatase family metal-dependent hydrolase
VTVHETSEALTVMTLNVWNKNKWRARRSAILEWINEIQPDLVALQEVIRSRRGCQASWIAKRTGMTATFGAARSISGLGEFGNAVLSRLPVRGPRCHPLTDASTGNEPRAILTVEADAYGRRVSFSSTHLSWQFDEGWIREQQVRDIADVLGPRQDDVLLIVCGDFNATPESAEMLFMKEFPLVDAYEAVHPGQLGYTWCNANPFAAQEHEPERRIDYILVAPSPEGAGRVVSADVVCNEPRWGTWPSDHYGVAARLSLPRHGPETSTTSAQ